jgi:regulation of enolase protein 1 (concanavalin A-like superfamily)
MFRIGRVLVFVVATGVLVAPATAEERKTETLKGWGQIIDPDSDCLFREAKGKLEVTVPGTAHDLNGGFQQYNAPRVLQEVEGDFILQVKVSGDFKPGDTASAPGRYAFNGAGLILWESEKNYIRLERNIWVTPEGKTFCFPPLFEHWKDGQYMKTNPEHTEEPFFKDRFTYLRLERRGDKIQAAVSHEGREWMSLKAITVELPKKVRVGVAAINTSKRPFTVEFEELKLTIKREGKDDK